MEVVAEQNKQRMKRAEAAAAEVGVGMGCSVAHIPLGLCVARGCVISMLVLLHVYVPGAGRGVASCRARRRHCFEREATKRFHVMS